MVLKMASGGVADYLETLKKEVLGHPVMRHPFWVRFRKGDLTSRQLQLFGGQYYQHVKRTRLYAAAVLSRTPVESIQAAIASVLWDEYGNGDPDQTHPAQFRKLLRALGLPEDQWDVQPLPELEIYSDVHFRLCTDHSVWAGLGVVGVAMELPIPTLYQYLIEGFVRSGLKEADLEFFIRHGPMDVQHADLLLQSIIPQLTAEADRKAFRWGALRSMDARHGLMNGLYRTLWNEPTGPDD